jgi:hypothetical protein
MVSVGIFENTGQRTLAPCGLVIVGYPKVEFPNLILRGTHSHSQNNYGTPNQILKNEAKM